MKLTLHARVVRRLSSLLRSKGRIPKRLAPFASGPLGNIAKWGWQENIVGLALGWKGTSRVPALTIFVRRKLHPSRLPAEAFVPKASRPPMEAPTC